MPRTIEGMGVFLLPQEVADALGVSRSTLLRWVREKKQPLRDIKFFTDPCNGYRYFSEDAVEKLREGLRLIRVGD